MHHKENSWEPLLISIARIKVKNSTGGVFSDKVVQKSGKRNIV